MILARRSLFAGLSGIIALSVAPGIVRASSIMPINQWLGLDLPDQVAMLDFPTAGGGIDLSASACWLNRPGGIGRVVSRAIDFNLDLSAWKNMIANRMPGRISFMGIPVVDGKTAYRAGLIFKKEKFTDWASINNRAEPLYHSDHILVCMGSGASEHKPPAAPGDRGAETPA